MPTIAIFTLRDFSSPYGSNLRPVLQADGLRKNRFDDFVLCSGKLSSEARLIHAHQDAIYHVGNRPYIADLHGIAWLTSKDSISRMPFSIRKYRALYRWLPRQKRKEEEAYGRAICLICAGESIREKVAHLNRTEVVRNAVDIKKYGPTLSPDLRVAVVGPFVEGHENLYALEMFHQILKIDRKTKYVVIGQIEARYREALSRFRNVVCEGFVEDFVGALRKCSVLLSPYPKKSGSGGAKNKVIEAAACSIPIVSTPEGIVDFNEKLILVADSPKELLDKILYLANDDVRRTLGKELRLEVEQKHDHIKESKKLLNLYEELLGQNS